jgi:sugar/nucleoside kinase (ribokinase family)
VSRVAVVGNLSNDVIDGGAPTPGGCPFFAAEAFRRLGRDGQIVTRFRDADADLFGPVLDALGVPVTLLAADATSGFSLDYAGEEREMGVTEIGETWRTADAQAVASDAAWVHVAPLLRSDFPAVALAALAAGRRLSLDGQGLIRVPKVGRLEIDAAYDPAVLEHVTALKLSEEEALIVAGGPFDREAAATLGVSEVLLTLGSHGAVVFVDGSETFIPAAWPVLGVQTTGAGDAFMVGYAVARVDGDDPVGAARRASRLVAEMLEERPRRADGPRDSVKRQALVRSRCCGGKAPGKVEDT